MKSKTVKALIGGSVAAVLALGIALPSQAGAASAQTTTVTTPVSCEQLLKAIQQYYNQAGMVTATKPSAVTAGTVTAAVPKAATATAAGTGTAAAPKAATATAAGTTAAASGKTASAAGTTGSAAGTAATSASAFVKEVVTLVNAERAQAGLAPLTALDSLNKVAAAKAADMRVNQYFSHTSPTYGSPFDMMKSFGISYGYAGENIAMGQKTPQQVMEDWMNSPGHKANILSPNFDYIGVGYDNNYWVQEFTGK